jgi:hypothetical protein
LFFYAPKDRSLIRLPQKTEILFRFHYFFGFSRNRDKIRFLLLFFIYFFIYLVMCCADVFDLNHTTKLIKSTLIFLELAIGRIESDKLDKKIPGHGSGSGQSDPGRVAFWVEHCQIFLDFGSDRVRFWVLSSSGHFGFWVIRVRVKSGFRSSDIG